MPLHCPMQRAAIANACRCMCQRSTLRSPTHAAAFFDAADNRIGESHFPHPKEGF